MQSQRTSQHPLSLTYRGISYQHTPVFVATEPTQTTACYRSVPYQLQRSVDLTVVPRHNLKYRGVSYHNSSVIPMPLGNQAIPSPV
jgi:hypothetical protein